MTITAQEILFLIYNMRAANISPPIHGTGVVICNRPDLENVRRLDRCCMPMICDMQKHGMRVDRGQLTGLHTRLTSEMEDLHTRITKMTGRNINIGSGDQLSDLLFHHLRDKEGKLLKQNGREKWTRSKTRLAADSDVLKAMVSQHPSIRLILDWKEREKLRSTYTLSLAAKLDSDDRLHTDIGTVTAETGRLTCVAGSTILPTSRGNFCFKHYIPQIGDMAFTHRGRWMPIKRKIFKGIDGMFRVCLTNGYVLECTRNHRLFTSVGWLKVKHLHEREQVISFCGVERQVNSQDVLCDGQAYNRADSQEVWDYLPDCPVCAQETHGARTLSSGKADQIFPQQDGFQEPHAGQEWLPTPQLDRQGVIEGRLCYQEGRGRSSVRSSSGIPEGDWITCDAEGVYSSPYRRRQGELEFEQSLHGDSRWTQNTTRQEIQVSEITYVGEAGVWDIEVEEDHSYLAGGIFHHNSSNPNLQNIPIRTKLGKLIRDAFIPKQGNVMGAVDASQIEMRQNAHDARCTAMMDIFWAYQDFYWQTAEMMYKRTFTKEQRKCKCANVHVAGCPTVINEPGQAYDGLTYKEWYRFNAKTTALMTAYDASPGGLYDQFLITSPEAWQQSTPEEGERVCGLLISDYFKVFHEIIKRRKEHHNRTFRHMLNWDMFGRIRWIPQVKSCHRWVASEGLRAAGNLPGQGGAAGIIKIWMAILHRRIVSFYARHGLMILMQIHDELVVEGPRPVVEEFLQEAAHVLRNMFVKSEYQDFYDVPLDAGYAIADRWGQCKD